MDFYCLCFTSNSILLLGYMAHGKHQVLTSKSWKVLMHFLFIDAKIVSHKLNMLCFSIYIFKLYQKSFLNTTKISVHFLLITKHLNVTIFSLILRYVWNILFEILKVFISLVFRSLTDKVFLLLIAPWLSRGITSSLTSFLSLW